MKLFDIIWKNRSQRQKYAIMALCGAFICLTITGTALLANTWVHSTQSVELNTKKGHTTSVSMDVDGFGEELVSPGERRTLTCDLTNGSNTDNAYIFVNVNFDSNVWSIEPANGWSKVEGYDIYAYSNSGNMTSVNCGETINFSATMTVSASGTAYQNLNNEDFKVSVNAMAVNGSVSRVSIGESYDDYLTEGNQAMVAELEQA